MMRLKPAFLALALCGVVTAFPAHADFNILPTPSSITTPSGGKYRIDAQFSAMAGKRVGDRASRAVARFMARLAGRTGLFFAQDFLSGRASVPRASLVCSHQREGKLEPNENESYSLSVRPEGIELSSGTDIGIIRGLETLLQLLASDEGGYYFPVVTVRDEPRFTWRGLMIDASRHFMPVEVIKRNLDGMSAVKMNVLHWHLSDDQGFRVECRSFPKLHLAGSDGFYYSREEIKDIIEYAADLGIRVMPEFDIPGHSTSWLAAYPEYAASAGPFKIERGFGVFDPVFNPIDEKTYKFFDRFLGEMAALFPDPYIHIGGDEVSGVAWNANPLIRKFKAQKGLADNAGLQAYFNNRILRILTKYDKKMVGWDEVLQPGLPKDIVIQSWRGRQAMVQAARDGYQALLANGYYIDLCQPAWEHYLNDPVAEDSPLTEVQKKLILGGEATMWAELVTAETVDSRIWPRTAAIAERLWSPAAVRDVDDMYRRLDIISRELEELGLTHLKNQPMMLRRLSAGEEIEPLKVLADLTEPLKRYERHDQAAYTFLSPFTRFVDACAPESRAARDFSAAVDRFLKTRATAQAADMRSELLAWRGNQVRLRHLIDRSPVLFEIAPLSDALSLASEKAIQALDIIVSGVRARPEWTESTLAAIAEIKKPMAHAELAVLPAIEKLIQFASGR